MRHWVKASRAAKVFLVLGMLVASAVWLISSPNSVEAVPTLSFPPGVTYSSNVAACTSLYATLFDNRDFSTGVGLNPKVLTICGKPDRTVLEVKQLDTADNKASSLRGAGCMRVYEYPNFTGRSILYYSEGKGSTKQVYDNRDLHPAGWGDRISSLKFIAEPNNTPQNCLKLLP